MQKMLNRSKPVLLFVIALMATAGAPPAQAAESDGRRVDPSTLTGKVMCGYQGWFAAEGDGADRGWTHYTGARGQFKPGQCSIDLWPDLGEMDADEKYATPFAHKDGGTAYLFSSYNPKTVMRHFQWMEEHGIDGVFLQRFGSALRSPQKRAFRDAVTANVRAGAERHGRVWAMMYDLSALRPGEIERFVIEDWKRLVDSMKITQDETYLHHNGKPVVAVWGVGFVDGRNYTLEECERLVRFLKDDAVYGGNTVMLGVPTFWRTLTRDAVQNAKLHEVILRADIISPWTVGRYTSPAGAAKHARETMTPDIEWAASHGKEYLPVIFPGFSWHNLMRARGEESKLGQIPRLKGKFFWSQAVAARAASAVMLYVAMFDEIDEGTAIFKCTNDPPVGESEFLTYEGLPSDHYLWLAGKIGELIRGAIPPTEKMPVRAGR
jgi:hypothetical protein